MSTKNIPAYEPREIVAGITLKWERDFCDYPASQYSLTYHFRGAGKGFDAAAAADGDTFVVTVPAATTAEMTPGAYYWQAVAVKDGEKFVAAEGEAKAVASLAAVEVATVLDGRSRAKKILDAIDALLEGKATLDQQQYTISGGGGYRMLIRIPVGELIELRKTYARLVARERRGDRVRRGGTLFSDVKARFNEPR